MKNRDRYLPALLAWTQQSKKLHSCEVTDGGKMSLAQFWQSTAAPKLSGHSAVLFSGDAERTAQLLKSCPEISTGCLILSQQMAPGCASLAGLFPLGVVARPTPGGIYLWNPRSGMSLRGILELTKDFWTVGYLPGLQLSCDVIEHLYASHKTSGFLLISESLRQEMAGQASDVSRLFAADYLILHGTADSDAVSSCLPRTKVNQPVHTMVVNYHNPFTPMHSGKGMPLMSRGNDCTKPHKLSLSVSQSFSLAEKPLFDASELRQMRRDGVTAVLNQQSCDYLTVTLREPALTLSDRVHAFFDRTAGLTPQLPDGS